MGSLEEYLDELDDPISLYDCFKGSNMGAYVIVLKWKKDAASTFGSSHKLTKHYDSILEKLKKQRSDIDFDDSASLKKAILYTRDLNLEFGQGKKKIFREKII